MSEYTPTTRQVREAYEVAHEELGLSADPTEFDRWLAAHDRAISEQIARAIEERRENFIAETRRALNGLPPWIDIYLNGLNAAIDVARGEGSE